jgi:hypothetical protein
MPRENGNTKDCEAKMPAKMDTMDMVDMTIKQRR